MNPKSFLVEFMQRLVAEQPKFFKALSNVFVALLLFVGLVEFLVELGVTMPAWIGFVNTKVLGVASFLGIVLSRLPNKDINENK